MSGLKPCPFCGEKKLLEFTSNGHENEYVECGNCGCSGPPGIDRGDATEMWNERADHEPLGATEAAKERAE